MLKPLFSMIGAVYLAAFPTVSRAATFAAHGLNSPQSQGRILFKAAAENSQAPDTLEVYALYVQFKDEKVATDEMSTTGRGVFGSDIDTSYTLDPNSENIRKSQYYLEKHFEFAKNYFEKVSHNRVTITLHIFPKPNNSGLIDNPYTLDKRLPAYNPPEKEKKEKNAAFEERRLQQFMTFISESIHLADKGDAVDGNPFKTDTITSAKKFRAYMIFHAGHSRLLDGGNLGAFNANSAADLIDFFVSKPYFEVFKKATTSTGEPNTVLRKDSLGVQLSNGKTLTDIMLLSESASQDKLNWGINGILVNQLARCMGLPDMFDVVKGISKLGYFDMMDFAGYNTLNGFLPIYPSAWVRTYMGWEQPEVAKSGDSAFSRYKIWSPLIVDDINKKTALKIPLNEREYLLIENRQRNLNDSVTLNYSYNEDNSKEFKFEKTGSKTIPLSKIDSVFLDSLCDTKGKNCKVNPLKPKGIITSASSYDIGLPGNGLLVWHVNDWFIQSFLKYGAVNAYLGDTLKSQYQGVSLVEADGILSIGKEFRDALGQPAFDYGSGADMLPHFEKKLKRPVKGTDSIWVIDTTKIIGPYGNANTNAWNDGRTHIQLEVVLPATPKWKSGLNSFSGDNKDSVFTLNDSSITLNVFWPNNKLLEQKLGNAWPVTLDKGTQAQAVNFLKTPANTLPAKNWVLPISDRGAVQIFTNAGKPGLSARDSLPLKSGYDSVFTLLPTGNSRDTVYLPIPALTDTLGFPLGSATFGDSALAVLTHNALHLFRLRADSLLAQSRDSSINNVTVTLEGQVGPIIIQNKAWVISQQHTALSYDLKGIRQDSIPLPLNWKVQNLAAIPDEKGVMQLAAVAEGGKVCVLSTESKVARDVNVVWGDYAPLAEEVFTLSVSDFDRNGNNDLFLLGSRGSAHLVNLEGKSFIGFPQNFPRSIRIVDTAFKYQTEDRSSPALADINEDGYPDILFTVTNGLHAIDFHGAALPGWPFALEQHQAIGLLYGNKKSPETVVQSTPLVFALNQKPTILIASPDGLIWALNAQGKIVDTTSYEPNSYKQAGLLSLNKNDWPLTIGGSTIDSMVKPFIHLYLNAPNGNNNDLDLFAHTGSGSLNAWTLKKSTAKSGLSWLLPGGNGERQNYLNAALLPETSTSAKEENIRNFFLFPSPVRGATATIHLEIGTMAQKARIKIYDLAGVKVKEQEWTQLNAGIQPYTQVLDLSHLGPDVYSAQVEVWFAGGKKQKWVRFGVIR